MVTKGIQIIGAGLSGLLAASHFPEATIFERQERSKLKKHAAVLRFRSPDIGDHLGIEFKKVKVRKGIWFDDKFVEPNIQVCNMYSQKVSDMIVERSIWNIDDEYRWIAPDNLHEVLLEKYDSRIKYGIAKQDINYGPNIITISTAPLGETMSANGIELEGSFNLIKKPITVLRYRIKGASAYQTVYYPFIYSGVYRATLNGDILIVEYVGQSQAYEKNDIDINVRKSFGIQFSNSFEFLDCTVQQNGKIQPIDDHKRKLMIHHLTTTARIYSLGRFAIWKNILLDDVYRDIQVIKRLMNMSNYELVKKGCGD